MKKLLLAAIMMTLTSSVFAAEEATVILKAEGLTPSESCVWDINGIQRYGNCVETRKFLIPDGFQRVVLDICVDNNHESCRTLRLSPGHNGTELFSHH